MTEKNHVHKVNVYYEDTDFTGVVYHSNYLKYFERAREHLFGVEQLMKLWEEGVGFVVYRVEITYRGGAVYGDQLEIHTIPVIESSHRISFKQRIFRPYDQRYLVNAIIELVCVDHSRKLVRLPQIVVDDLSTRWP